MKYIGVTSPMWTMKSKPENQRKSGNSSWQNDDLNPQFGSVKKHEPSYTFRRFVQTKNEHKKLKTKSPSIKPI